MYPPSPINALATTLASGTNFQVEFEFKGTHIIGKIRETGTVGSLALCQMGQGEEKVPLDFKQAFFLIFSCHYNKRK